MIKTRLKAAVKAFLDPVPPPPAPWPPATVPPPEPEPRGVLDNRLLAGKTVLLTGAGKNCGRAIALEMARQGARLCFADCDPACCASLEQELRAWPAAARGFVMDLTRPETIDALCAELEQAGIVPDVLVNNAGRGSPVVGDAALEPELWRTIFETNVFGPVQLTRRVAAMMTARGVRGSLLFVTSVHQETVSRWPAYSASKAALAMLVKELAVEFGPAAIRVNGIAPGWVAEDGQGEPLCHEFTPLYGRSVPPRYIGRAAVYLAADYFSHATTGAVLKIDAGSSLYNHRVAQDFPVPPAAVPPAGG